MARALKKHEDAYIHIPKQPVEDLALVLGALAYLALGLMFVGWVLASLIVMQETISTPAGPLKVYMVLSVAAVGFIGITCRILRD